MQTLWTSQLLNQNNTIYRSQGLMNGQNHQLAVVQYEPDASTAAVHRTVPATHVAW